MGINVGKMKRLEAANDNKGSASLESIANEYMKQDSYRRSANKYGLDLLQDDIADDVPPESRSNTPVPGTPSVNSQGNTKNLTPTKRTDSSEDLEDDGYYSKQEIEQYEEPTLTQSVQTQDLKPIRWQRGGLIGSGAFGKVFLGLNLDTGELLAVKQIMIVGDVHQQEREFAALEQEIAVMKGLSHENIVQYKGTSFEDNQLNIFLEYVPGGSISSLLNKFGGFSESVVRAYTRQILLGLEYLHRHHIIHRDIKGANILVDNNGTIKLADFGASKKLQGLLNATGGLRSLKGTPYYMAPEVIRQAGHGRQADIWSVGSTVFEMFTGKPPWSDIEDQVSALFHIAQSNAPPTLPSTISLEAQDFLLQCFTANPKERPNATRLLEHPFIKGAPIKVVQNGSPRTRVNNGSTQLFKESSREHIERLPVPTKSGSSGSVSVSTLQKNSLKTSSQSKASKVHPESISSTPMKPRTRSNSATSDTMKSLNMSNPMEEPSWAWTDENRRNMNFLENKLKQSPNSSPYSSDKTKKGSEPRSLKTSSNSIEEGSSEDSSSTKVRNLHGDVVDETTINAFVRKSAATGIRRLVTEGSILESIRDTGLYKKNMKDDEVIDNLIKRAEKTRETALKASISADY